MFRVIKVASHLGAPARGTDKGPDAIIAALGLDHVITVKIPEENPTHSCDNCSRSKNLSEIKEINRGLIQSIKKVTARGDIPVVLLGDDSSVIGVGYGLYQSHTEPFGIIYLDAHGDINTPDTTRSGCLFGQGVAHLIGLGHPELLALNDTHCAIDHKNLVMIGQRNLDPGEVDLIGALHISVFDPKQVEKGIDSVLAKVGAKFKENGIRQVYIHIDQDVVNPPLSGSSLCQEPDGITDGELLSILGYVKDHFEICGLSMGNYLPSLDREGKTMRIIRAIWERVLDGSRLA